MKNIQFLLLITLFFLNHHTFAHEGGHHNQNNKREWHIKTENIVISASYLIYKDGNVYFENGNGKIFKYALSSLTKEDQAYVNKQDQLIRQINYMEHNSYGASHPLYQNAKLRGLFFSAGLLFLAAFLFLILWNKRYRKVSFGSAVLSIAFLVLGLVSCNKHEDSPSGKIIPPNDANFMSSLFANFSNVTTSSDANYFYVSSNGMPDHGMMEGITSWQQQVPIPQSYTGSNSWSIPMQPVLAENPTSTKNHLLKGAIAIAVNGIPIFNPLNNRGEDAKAFGELDTWGGHCGKADDYHYHLPPTHLESIVGSGKPIAYALDGFPVYGFTTEKLDEYLGILKDDGSYQYYTTKEFPYFIAAMRGKVSLDPKTTAPEDQIIPQAMSSPLRGGNYGPINGAKITSFKSTGTNAYSLQYTIGSDIYKVNYNWDSNNLFTFDYIAPSGTKVTETYKRK